MTRKYFHSSIQELETLFQKENDYLETLLEIQEELKFRKTRSAAKLQNLIAKRLVTLKQKPVPQYQKLQEHPPSSPPLSQSLPRSTEKHAPSQSDVQSPQPSAVSELPQVKSVTSPPPMPAITNRPEEILSAWTALEVLSPPAYDKQEDLTGGDKSKIVKLTSLPWETGEKSKPNFRLYYQIVLGSIEMKAAIEALIEKYGDTGPVKPSYRGQAALAVVVVDKTGRLVDSPTIGISSFGWGVMTALNGDLTDLANWSNVERHFVEELKKVFQKFNENELPLSKNILLAAYEKLISKLGLPKAWVEEPSFAIRSYVYFKDPNPPEPLLLNSFFLSDLALARQLFAEGKAPQNLCRYLGIEQPTDRQNLLQNTNILEEAVSPSMTHLSRWPSPNRHSLVLLQQAAVNLAFRETKTGGLLGINGPPGTGKTTLLRDLIAGIVTERAEAMAKFDDPEKAFEHSGQKIKAGNAWIHLYRLNESLRGFEIVVASSNNKAVENVSSEIPGLRAIADDATELRYFKTLSDALHQSETWGIIAAVLGNTQNRSRFKQTFWWDDDNGLNSYLKAAAGLPLDPRKIPLIVEAEKPPTTHEDAIERWNNARKRFLEALQESRLWQTWLENLRTDLKRLPMLREAEASAAAKLDAAIAASRRLEIIAAAAQQAESSAASQLELVTQELHAHTLVKPSFWARLFRTTPAREWSNKLRRLRANHRAASDQSTKMTTEYRRIKDELQQSLINQKNAGDTWQAAKTKLQQVEQLLVEAQQKYNVVFADDTFFKSTTHNKRHQTTPWFPPRVQHLRDEVFISAIAMHRAFLDAAAKPMRHNLGALMNVFTAQTLPDDEKQKLLPDLWASLFLVVPLVSTTFASVNRMLGKLPIKSLGWLLVDEAGQALPQAAVGALLRTRHAIIVGDPIQIEPVVVLPDTLTHAICRRFGVDPNHYAAPQSSVQTLADAASTYISEFQANVGSRSVGIPLLVHRRCSEPMFSISNKIAYSQQMVSAKSPKPSAIQEILGKSAWIHVEGSGEDKWCQEEGNETLRLLRLLAQAGVNPDLYIITPFVIVADRLRKLIRESGVLKGWVEENDWRWVNERIGTIHTVQGREAESVIFVLGAPLPVQTGARNWAGGRPNLLNVAVTRAKESIYVIGNRRLWREAGLFSELDKKLPSSEA
jgi:hypothetical protein